MWRSPQRCPEVLYCMRIIIRQGTKHAAEVSAAVRADRQWLHCRMEYKCEVLVHHRSPIVKTWQEVMRDSSGGV